MGASPVQNRFGSLDAVHLRSGVAFSFSVTLCAFGYRDSVCKHSSVMGRMDKTLITRVRFALPKAWKPELGYAVLERKKTEFLQKSPSVSASYGHSATQIYE